MKKRTIQIDGKWEIVQEYLLQAMDEIHALCVKNDIRYYLIGGSALGAIRHNGFIPWDVDIDIAMPREDYERFAQVSKNALPEGLSYHDYKNTKGYYRPHAVICLDNIYAYINSEYYLKSKEEKLFIDIFPLDNAPNDERLREQQAKELAKLKKIQSRKECVLYKRNSKLQILIKKLIKLILSLYSLQKLERKRERIMTLYSQDESSRCWCSMVSHYSYKKQCIEKEVYGTPKKMIFAGREYFVPEQTAEYLKRIFGNNYMQLPPVEQRIRPDDVIEKIVIYDK